MPDQSTHTLRLFIALELPSQLRSHLSGVIETLRSNDNRAVKWVSPNNMHLTLKFLGETPLEQIEEIKIAIGKTVADTTNTEGAFKLQSTTLGAFPNLNRPRVFWASCGGDQENELSRLEKFAGAIDDSLGDLEIEKEERAFKAHLTLGRVRRPRPGAKAPNMSALIDRLKNYKYETINFEINILSLYQSQLTRQGPIYTALESWEFAGERFG